MDALVVVFKDFTVLEYFVAYNAFDGGWWCRRWRGDYQEFDSFSCIWRLRWRLRWLFRLDLKHNKNTLVHDINVSLNIKRWGLFNASILYHCSNDDFLHCFFTKVNSVGIKSALSILNSETYIWQETNYHKRLHY